MHAPNTAAEEGLELISGRRVSAADPYLSCPSRQSFIVMPFRNLAPANSCQTVVQLLQESETAMATTTVSDKYEITIPEEVRSGLDIKPGQEVELVRNGDHIEIVPVRSIREARGFLEGIRTTTIEREPDRRL
jgi:AbrB family looped-hinge helix DNA binding protein